jgi:hypothetical protein
VTGSMPGSRERNQVIGSTPGSFVTDSVRLAVLSAVEVSVKCGHNS